MIYDVVLNFNKNAYDFYEWNNEDEIINIKQILSYKVDEKTLFDFYYHNVLIDKEFLKKIENKTEVFYKRDIKNIKYACIFYDDELALAFLFTEKGKVVGKSKMLFEESDEIVRNKKENKIIEINYNIISYNEINKYKTRYELKSLNILYNYLNKIYDEKRYEELKYMYFEIFDKKIEDEEKLFIEFKKKIKNLDYQNIKKLIELIKVIKK